MTIADQTEYDRIFGRYERQDGRRAFLVNFEGEVRDLCSPGADNIRGAYLEDRERRKSSTRDAIISDIEPFRTGVTDGWGQVVGGRRDKREFMKRHDVVEFEPTMPMREEFRPPREEIRQIVRELANTDTALSDAFAPVEANRPDRDGLAVDETEVVPV